MRVALTRNPSPASLASHVHTMVSMLEYCRLNGHEAYVDWTNQPAMLYRSAALGANQWDWFCEQPTPKWQPEQRWVWDQLNWKLHCPKVGELPFNAETKKEFAKLRRIVPLHLRLNQTVRDYGDALLAKNGIQPELTIAVSFRGTDKGVESPIAPIEDFFETVEQAINNCTAPMSLWIQAEEIEARRKFRARFPWALWVPEFFAAPSGATFADYLNPKIGVQKGTDACAMMYMMSRCAVIVKNASNLADLAVGLGTSEVYHVRGSGAFLPRHPQHVLTNQGGFAWAS